MPVVVVQEGELQQQEHLVDKVVVDLVEGVLELRMLVTTQPQEVQTPEVVGEVHVGEVILSAQLVVVVSQY
jgi:hypothetical protein